MAGLHRVERAALGAIALLTVLAGVARYAGGVSSVPAFALATGALAGLAWIVSFSTEQVGQRFGPAVTGGFAFGDSPEANFPLVLQALTEELENPGEVAP